MRVATLALGFFLGAIVFVGASLVLAWTGPTQTAPNGNVAAPINVGTTDQIKNAGLGVNSLAVFGNAIISTVSGYLNFGTTAGVSGYGIRDNGGVMEVKSNNGAWQAIGTSTPAGVGAGPAGIFGQIFNSSGTFTVPEGITAVKVILIGGGGGSYDFGCNGGGGGGGTATKWVTGLMPGTAMPVVVGAGGSGVANGDSSSFAGVTAGGGFVSHTTAGGAGGTTSGADLGVTGGSGGQGVCAFGNPGSVGGISRGEYSNMLGYNFGGGAGRPSSPAQSGVAIIQW